MGVRPDAAIKVQPTKARHATALGALVDAGTAFNAHRDTKKSLLVESQLDLFPCLHSDPHYPGSCRDRKTSPVVYERGHEHTGGNYAVLLHPPGNLLWLPWH